MTMPTRISTVALSSVLILAAICASASGQDKAFALREFPRPDFEPPEGVSVEAEAAKARQWLITFHTLHCDFDAKRRAEYEERLDRMSLVGILSVYDQYRAITEHVKSGETIDEVTIARQWLVAYHAFHCDYDEQQIEEFRAELAMMSPKEVLARFEQDRDRAAQIKAAVEDQKQKSLASNLAEIERQAAASEQAARDARKRWIEAKHREEMAARQRAEVNREWADARREYVHAQKQRWERMRRESIGEGYSWPYAGKNIQRPQGFKPWKPREFRPRKPRKR